MSELPSEVQPRTGTEFGLAALVDRLGRFHRRFARHWSVPQIRAELKDSFAIELSEDAIEDYLQRYQCMLAARQQDFALLQGIPVRQTFPKPRQVKNLPPHDRHVPCH